MISVKNLARKYNCFFIHSVYDLFFAADTFRWIVLFRGTISVSSLRPDTNDWLWPGTLGFLLREGKVLRGCRHDMLTSPIDLKERWSPYNGIAGTMESIEKAIDRPTGPLLSETERIGNYNELVVVNPIAAGFYFIYYGDLPKNKDEVITFKTVIYGGVPLFDSDLLLHFLKQAYLLHLQLYILTPDNHVRKLHDVNFSEKSFKLSPDLSPVEIVEPSWPWCLEE